MPDPLPCYPQLVRLRRLIILAIVVIALAAVAVTINRRAIPDRNTTATHFDALIVLGDPATRRGNPSSGQRERVLEAVREYKAGVAPVIIVTGGAAHNQFVEADTMAALALRQGVPASAVIKESQALNTIQNLYYSSQIMHAHSWTSAEVISTSAHLGRAALILEALSKDQPSLAIQWRTHPAPWPREYSLLHRTGSIALEATRCLELRVFGFPHSSFLP